MPPQLAIARNEIEGGARFGDVPYMTSEMHKRRGDAADKLFREIVRRISRKR